MRIIARDIENTAWMLNSKNDVKTALPWIMNFENGVSTLLKIIKCCGRCKSSHKADKMTKAPQNHINCSEMLNAIQERKRCNNPVAEYHSIPTINWGSFRGRGEEKWRSFWDRYHFGVKLGFN